MKSQMADRKKDKKATSTFKKRSKSAASSSTADNIGSSQAKSFISAVSKSKTAAVTALVHGTLEERSNAIEEVGAELCAKARDQVELQKKKIEEIRSKIQQIVAGNKRGRGVEFNEFVHQQTLKTLLQEKLFELEWQQNEFCGYMDILQSRLKTFALQRNCNALVKRCCKEFELELKQFRRSLPVYARKSYIIETIIKNKICIIVGETGSGKSTQILQYIYAAGLHKSGLVVCTQPRKLAAVSLARHVFEEMGSQRGLIGYTVGGQSNRERRTKFLYVTDHVLLNECLKDHLLSNYSVIVADEVHERSVYSDLLLGFLKLALRKRSDLHVVIMSATINPDSFVSYFSDISMPGSKPPVVHILGRTFLIDVYQEESSEDYVKAACLKAFDIHRNEPPGDILVFLTSGTETRKACEDVHIMSQCGNDAGTFHAVELHGRLQAEDQQKAFDSAPPGMRKIVFATNIAETSVTIPGIKYVIDSGRAKEMSYDAKRNMSTQNVRWVTKSSAEQRKGRAGRTDCGKCYRLYSEKDFVEMREQSVPEILRIHLGQAMLKLIALGISDPMAFDFIEAPSRNAVDSALSVLQDIGAYDKNGITEVGKKLSKIPLEPRLGKAVLTGIDRGIPQEAVVMAAVCTVGGSIFFRGGTGEDRRLSNRRKTRFCDEWGDIVTLVNVYKEWITVAGENRNEWCMENSISAKSMRAARNTVAELRRTLKMELNIDIPNGFTEGDAANEKMARILYELYSLNLSRFSGYEREGFLLANLPSTVLRVHPSSALNYMEELPTWVVYEQTLITSTTFLLNATYVKEEWVQEWISSGKLKLSLDYLSLFVLKPSSVQYVGSQCIRSLMFNKAESKSRLEAKIKTGAEDTKCHIDISLVGRNRGTLTLYSNSNCQLTATSLVNSYLDDIRKSLADECIEQPLFPNSSVWFIIDRGGEIRIIMMPDESRVLKVMCTRDIELTETIVYRELSQFGVIEKMKKDITRDSFWGTVTFKFPEQAEKALTSVNPLSPLKLEAYEYPAANKENSENFIYTVKVVGVRRALRGFGFVQFEDALTVSLVANEIGLRSFIIRKELGKDRVLEGTVEVQLDTKTSTQLFLNSIPTWANENIVRTGLQRALDNHNVKIVNVILPRETFPYYQELYDEFQQALRDKLCDSGITETDYIAIFPRPNEKWFDYIAFLQFHDCIKARSSSGILHNVEFNNCFMDAFLLFKIVFCIPLAVNEFCAGHLQEKIAGLQRTANGSIGSQSKIGKWSVVTSVDATCLDDLVLARETLSPLLGGRKVKLNRHQISFVNSKPGIQLLKTVESLYNVKSYVDGRQTSVLIFASFEDVAAEAAHHFSELMYASMAEISKDISLRNIEYPRGLMKALVVQYGPNLEQLKQDSGMDSLDLILRQHKIRALGGKEAFEKLMDLINEKAQEVNERRPVSSDCSNVTNSSSHLPECPVCFESATKEIFYVMEYCNHVYCQDCATALVDNAIRGNDIPIRCCFENCNEPLVIRDFRNLLHGNLGPLYDAAIRSFMLVNGDSYSHCITPECRTIYRRAPPGKSGEVFHCSECRVTLCTACNAAAHPGLLQCIKDREEISKWTENDPSSRCSCPKCGNGIEKDGGCMHVKCKACRIHFCWHCKEQFVNGQLCYSHLVKVHGAI